MFPNWYYTFTSQLHWCTLKSSTTEFGVKSAFQVVSSPAISNSTVNVNVAYCQLTDKVNERLPANTTLTLTITLPAKISPSWIS